MSAKKTAKTAAPTIISRIDPSADALRDALIALQDLTFEERIRTIRWVCEYYAIANVALYQGDGTFRSQR